VEHDGVSVQCALMPLGGGVAQVSAHTRTSNSEHFTLASSQPNMADRARCRRKLCPTSMSQRPLGALEVRDIKFRLRKCTTAARDPARCDPSQARNPQSNANTRKIQRGPALAGALGCSIPLTLRSRPCPPCSPPATVCPSSNAPPPGPAPAAQRPEEQHAGHEQARKRLTWSGSSAPRWPGP
jgi:hypothetical protein